MDQKTLEIVKAAWVIFARYGYVKSTMSDIAREAGVARQTLYNAFPSKESVLRAVVRLACEDSLAALHKAWEDDQGLEQKISDFQRIGPRSWYEAMRVTPDWAALMDGMHAAAAEELKASEVAWVGSLEDMLSASVGAAVDAEVRAEVARFLYSASKNAKYGVDSIEEFDRRLVTIRKAALALLNG